MLIDYKISNHLKKVKSHSPKFDILFLNPSFYQKLDPSLKRRKKFFKKKNPKNYSPQTIFVYLKSSCSNA